MSDLHPDRHANVPEDERREVADRASAVTRARDVLKDPVGRSSHLLDLVGGGGVSEDSGGVSREP